MGLRTEQLFWGPRPQLCEAWKGACARLVGVGCAGVVRVIWRPGPESGRNIDGFGKHVLHFDESWKAVQVCGAR